MYPELKELVVEASRALARLDAGRLEELALSCQALNRNLVQVNGTERELLARQAREAAGDMATFARVLEATRANLRVMNRLRELRAGRLEYGERQARGMAGTEGVDGNN
jgi:aminopeptidase N